MIKFVIVVLCVVALETLILIISIRHSNAQKKENQRLKNDLEKQKRNTVILAQYVEDLTDVKKDKDKITQKIQEAENEEEFNTIIGDLIARNNERVQNNPKK